MGRLAGGDRPGVQLHEGHHAPLLHRRTGPGDRRTGRHRGARTPGRGPTRRLPSAWCWPPCWPPPGWSFILLTRTPQWLPWLRWVLLIGAILAAAALAAGAARFGRQATVALAASGLLFGFAGTAAYTIDTAATPPRLGTELRTAPRRQRSPPGRQAEEAFGGPDISANTALIALVRQADNRWAAATVAPHRRRPATGQRSVGDVDRRLRRRRPSPTLEQFKTYVADGKSITSSSARSRVTGGPGALNGHSGFGPGFQSGTGTQITDWVNNTSPRRTSVERWSTT